MLRNTVNVCVFAVFAVIVHGESDGTGEVSVSVMEGDSVTLYTKVTINQQDHNKIMWYFNDSRIAHIYGNHSKICTDEPCEKRFRDRLKVDSHTGDLTITNIRNTDSGVYQLKVRSNGSIFIVTVSGVSAAEQDKMQRKSVKEGESVTLEIPKGKNPNDVTWYFNGILIAEITGDQSKICTDVQCDERFRDRLKVNHQTGSLTIMNTRTTDSGDYKVELIISNSKFSITSIKSFSITVADSGLSPGSIAGISAAVFAVLLVAAGGIYYQYRSSRNDKERNMQSVPYEVLQNDGERPNDWKGSN